MLDAELSRSVFEAKSANDDEDFLLFAMMPLRFDVSELQISVMGISIHVTPGCRSTAMRCPSSR